MDDGHVLPLISTILVMPSSLSVSHLGERRGENISQHGLPGASPESCILTPVLQGKAEVGHSKTERGFGVTAASLKQPLNAATLGGFLLLQIAAGPCTTD